MIITNKNNRDNGIIPCKNKIPFYWLTKVLNLKYTRYSSPHLGNNPQKYQYRYIKSNNTTAKTEG